jgi:methyltransferase (TIGR00027 family)
MIYLKNVVDIFASIKYNVLIRTTSIIIWMQVRVMQRRIETKTSRTAEMNCLMRALSYGEKRAAYKSGDGVSLVIMNGFVKFLIHIPFARRRFMDIYSGGMYEYVIARTRHIDGEMKKALREGVEQVLIFGAGFDTRAIRFAGEAGAAKIFELDAPVTQNAKIARYREKGVRIPENLVFVPIDFDRQSVAERLAERGFEKGRKCLFILEGLVMYLQPGSVDDTFRMIGEWAGEGSRIVFDFALASVVRREAQCDGAEEMTRSLAKISEGFQFGIEPEQVGGFLSKYGFKTLDILDAPALEDRYFKDEKAGPPACVSRTHCLVNAISPVRPVSS